MSALPHPNSFRAVGAQPSLPHAKGSRPDHPARLPALSVMLSLTPKQAQLKKFARDYIAANDCAPSFDEIRIHLKLRTKSNVHRIVQQLVERGHVYPYPRGHARTMRLVEQPCCPNCGVELASGKPPKERAQWRNTLNRVGHVVAARTEAR